MKRSIDVRKITVTAVFAAIMCVIAPFSVPVGVIPISLATFAVFLCSLLLGAKRGTAAVVCYIMLGMLGLPVFSGFSGGIGRLLGPTGGFIVGYIPCALICGLLSEKLAACGSNKIVYFLMTVLSVFCGVVSCYICGIAWYMIVASVDIVQAAAVCVSPFILPESIKIVAASVISCAVSGRIRGFIEKNK